MAVKEPWEEAALGGTACADTLIAEINSLFDSGLADHEIAGKASLFVNAAGAAAETKVEKRMWQRARSGRSTGNWRVSASRVPPSATVAPFPFPSAYLSASGLVDKPLDDEEGDDDGPLPNEIAVLDSSTEQLPIVACQRGRCPSVTGHRLRHQAARWAREGAELARLLKAGSQEWWVAPENQQRRAALAARLRAVPHELRDIAAGERTLGVNGGAGTVEFILADPARASLAVLGALGRTTCSAARGVRSLTTMKISEVKIFKGSCATPLAHRLRSEGEDEDAVLVELGRSRKENDELLESGEAWEVI